MPDNGVITSTKSVFPSPGPSGTLSCRASQYEENLGFAIVVVNFAMTI